MSSTVVPRRSRAAAWQRIDGEMVLLQPDVRELLGVNTVGGRAWELMDGERTFDQIAAILSTEFAVGPERVTADLRSFVRELVQAQLIEPCDL
jgi:hypothetical protein